jgi:hypothetical protein
MVERRIQKPNLYYVGPVDYRCELSEHFCSEYFDVEIFMPHPEEDLTKEIATRSQKRGEYLNTQPNCIGSLTPFDMNDQEFTYILYDLIIGFSHL